MKLAIAGGAGVGEGPGVGVGDGLVVGVEVGTSDGVGGIAVGVPTRDVQESSRQHRSDSRPALVLVHILSIHIMLWRGGSEAGLLGIRCAGPGAPCAQCFGHLPPCAARTKIS